MVLKKQILTTFLSISFFTILLSQTPITLPQIQNSLLRCGTKVPTDEQIRYTIEFVAKQVINRNSGTTCVPIAPHIVRNDDGTGGISILDLNKGLANLNYVYKAANIEFYWSSFPDYANNSDYVTYNEQSSDSDTETNLKALFTTATNAVNVYYVGSIVTSSGFNASGYAYFPSNTALSNVAIMTYSAQTGAVNGTFAHEFGHYFNLYHTHQGTEFGNTNANAENVPRTGTNANCSTKGDLLCDTHADPLYNSAQFNLSTCTYTGGGTDINGVPYTPPVENIMSYYPNQCGVNYFTPQQYTRIAQGLATRLTHTTYSLNAPPMSVTNPSGLTAVQSNGQVTLTWADNASNDMGYLIERSTTSSSSGFEAITFGGTTTSATTYTDANIVNNNTYYYRVKASNDGCNDYSNVATITIIPSYCSSVYTTSCYTDGNGIPMTIGEFKLTTTTNTTIIINTNNTCLGTVSDYTSISGNVTAGTAYNFSIKPTIASSSCYRQDFGIWLDINNDKDFDDTNEFLGAFDGVASCGAVTGSIIIPSSTLNGARRLRIRSVFNTSNLTSTNACTNFSAGEAEDYTLNVSNGVLPIELLNFKGRTNKNVNTLTWATASEKDNAYFIIERSMNGQDFSKLAEVKGAGTSNHEINYAFDDVAPIQGTNYYRLIQVDFDGKQSYSQTIAVNRDNKITLSVYPNPTNGIIHITTGNNSEERIEVTNLMGEVVLKTTINDAKSLDLGTLSAGIYVIRTSNGLVQRVTKY